MSRQDNLQTTISAIDDLPKQLSNRLDASSQPKHITLPLCEKCGQRPGSNNHNCDLVLCKVCLHQHKCSGVRVKPEIQSRVQPAEPPKPIVQAEPEPKKKSVREAFEDEISKQERTQMALAHLAALDEVKEKHMIEIRKLTEFYQSQLKTMESKFEELQNRYEFNLESIEKEKLDVIADVNDANRMLTSDREALRKQIEDMKEQMKALSENKKKDVILSLSTPVAKKTVTTAKKKTIKI